jgi:hypothetical protein
MFPRKRTGERGTFWFLRGVGNRSLAAAHMPLCQFERLLAQEEIGQTATGTSKSRDPKGRVGSTPTPGSCDKPRQIASICDKPRQIATRWPTFGNLPPTRPTGRIPPNCDKSRHTASNHDKLRLRCVRHTMRHDAA